MISGSFLKAVLISDEYDLLHGLTCASHSKPEPNTLHPKHVERIGPETTSLNDGAFTRRNTSSRITESQV